METSSLALSAFSKRGRYKNTALVYEVQRAVFLHANPLVARLVIILFLQHSKTVNLGKETEGFKKSKKDVSRRNLVAQSTEIS